mmetsp:Transcript_322/g.309  ORF Transcript_322/g.309 Transcript_322/m.309 type:complete len:125 (-) Transcript_322:41-415(-)|eukprot:CAMPEP_0174818242 /NCGR_PEP_ID=MMETSP1107-20130205/897_1 /TAXON_ID=36770 /ORGANISM="Paraphysomonas vestita, Strain GFlagA" /LENGTH=124 /DNA_ID=CAMNT_0016029845 /DNA_START=69 /DNA_END=443 /DNA_ORIENTATION=-
MIKRVVSRVNLVNKAIGIRRGGDGHHGPRMLPFARLAPPTEQLPIDADLVWDDGVAPETCVDIELPNVPTSQVLISQLCGILFFLGVYGIAVLVDPANRRPVAPIILALPSKEEMMFDDNHGRG